MGYGWKDKNFNFSAEENVDCLACHDTTGIYKKPPGFAGNPVIKDTESPPGSGKIIKGIDITKVAQKVGKSSRAYTMVRDTYTTLLLAANAGEAA